ncbi:hypothetical protein FKM82_020332 [Ascaphus truei]
MQPSLDRSGRAGTVNKKAVASLRKGLKANQLTDIWRELHPTDRDYMFYSHSHGTYSRIDYFFVSCQLVPMVSQAGIHDISWSDHAPIELRCEHIRTGRPGANWKLNESILKIPEICEAIGSEIDQFFHINTGSVDSQFMLWEAHKATLRGILISTTAGRKRERDSKIVELQTKLHSLTLKHKGNPDSQLLQELLLTSRADNSLSWSKRKFYEKANRLDTMLAQASRDRNVHSISWNR